MPKVARTRSHLEYYAQYGISPVHYDLSDLDAHFERRASLYRLLGLTPLAFRGARVLEVAAGTGQNSLYVATLAPRSLTLVEPNRAGLERMRALYASTRIAHTAPQIVEHRLEDIEPGERYDIVLCENWLGSSAHERSLLRKLARFVSDDGVLVITTVPALGLVANLLRRVIADWLAAGDTDYARKTALLVEAFGSHLSTLAAMTRTPIDWVQDNMLNPAYFGLCLDARSVLAEIGQCFTVLGSSPSLATDWRWFKALHGRERTFNEHFLLQHDKVSHNFVDQRYLLPEIPETAAADLRASADRLLQAAVDHLAALDARDVDAARAARADAGAAARALAASEALRRETSFGLLEAAALLEGSSRPEAADVAAAPEFGALFGRETLYLSFLREHRASLEDSHA